MVSHLSLLALMPALLGSCSENPSCACKLSVLPAFSYQILGIRYYVVVLDPLELSSVQDRR